MSPVDENKLRREVEALASNPEKLREELLKIRTRQKTQQLKQQAKGHSTSDYQKRQREKFKAMKAEAIRLGVWDQIEEQAKNAAKEKYPSRAEA
jgi:hypothetical protein